MKKPRLPDYYFCTGNRSFLQPFWVVSAVLITISQQRP